MVRVKYSDELYHHGIKGQKWGVRRFQNEDGSLTSEGRERYGVGEHGISRFNTSKHIKKSLGRYTKAIGVGGVGGALAGAGIGAATAGIPTGGVLAVPGALYGGAYGLGAGVGVGLGAGHVYNTVKTYKEAKADWRKKHDRYKSGKMSKEDKKEYEAHLRTRGAARKRLAEYSPGLASLLYDDYLNS